MRTVKVNVPEVQDPCDPVPVFEVENLPASVPERGVGFAAVAAENPEIITVELGTRSTFAVSVTVIVLAAPARGALC